MLNLINKILGKERAESQNDLTAPLALAVLLFEAAHADGECSDAEKAHLISTLVTDFKVSEQDINHLVRKTDSEEYVDLFRYTRFINENFTEKEKIKILEAVWRIILLDGQLEAHEDHFVHKLANLFHLNHSDLIAAKLRARRKLSASP